MTITFATVKNAVYRHLSIIGKRLYSKDGKNMFSDITLSSAEKEEILSQYIHASVHDIEAALKQLITATSFTSTAGGSYSITITNNRGDSDFETRTQQMSESYATLNSVAEYLSMVHPDLAQKYYRDAQLRMEMLIAYVFYKKPPIAQSSTISFTDPTGTVTDNGGQSDDNNDSGGDSEPGEQDNNADTPTTDETEP